MEVELKNQNSLLNILIPVKGVLPTFPFFKNITFIRSFLLALMVIVSTAGCDDSEDHPDNYRYNDGPIVTPGKIPSEKICISWLTSSDISTELFYGETENNLDGEFVDIEKTRYHNACLTNLSPDTTYFYQIPLALGDNSEETIYSFTTLPDGTEDFTFVLIGDMQPSSEDEAARVRTMSEAVLDENPHMVIQLGDFVQRGTNQNYWHHALTGAAPLISSIPMATVLGNHDWGYDDGSVWRKVFPFDYEFPDSSAYAINNSNARFLFLDCYEENYSLSAEQLIWLEDQLESTPADSFLFVIMHASIFSSGTENMDRDIQEMLAPLFDKYDVTAVFYGHDHMYEHYNFTYGENGYLFDSSHNWEHTPVNYFLSGGGGSRLESEYGLMDRSEKSVTRSLYNQETDLTESLYLSIRPWNPQKFVDWAPVGSSPDSPNYYHITSEESYQDESQLFGHEYGENTMHYIKVVLGTDSCQVTVHYPDGSLLQGPQMTHPQQFTIPK
jgi:predicted phosphodiesterase